MSHFFLIYEAGKNHNINELGKLLAMGSCIDERFGKWTPAAKLMADGEQKAAELLIFFGADVREIAFVAATQGKIAFAEQLTRDYGISFERIIEGAAASGLTKMKEYACDLYEKNESLLDCLFRGAAMGGDRHFVELLLEKYHAKLNLNTEEKKIRFYLNLINAAALGQQFKYRDELISACEKEAKLKNTHLNEIHIHTAISDPKQYRDQFDQLSPSLKQAVALGAVIGGDFGYADQLLAEQKSETSAIETFATLAIEYGHFNYAERVCLAPTESMLAKVVEAGHFRYAEIMSKKMKCSISVLEVMQHILRPRFPTPLLAVYALLPIQDQAFQTHLIEQLKEKNIFTYSIGSLEKDYGFIPLQKKYEANVNQILTWGHLNIAIFLLQLYQSSFFKRLDSKIISYIVTFLADVSYADSDYLTHHIPSIWKNHYSNKTEKKQELSKHTFLLKTKAVTDCHIKQPDFKPSMDLKKVLK